MTRPATVLGDRYELSEIIGRGGMAEVWRATDTRLHREVAVKRLRVDLATDPTFQARFRREAQSAAGLNHPNIVSVYDTGEAEDAQAGVMVPYIVMELVEGHTLKDVLRDGRKILPERALEFVRGALDALAYSHRAGIIHRDIKPANVMLTTGGVVKVMDFGIARAVADTSATMTQTAAVIGTAQYLSPEQARGETVDNRSDIYSAGCLLYELLVGRPPFVGDSPVSVAYQHVRETPVPPSELDPEVTPEMDAITLKALAKSPDERYQTAEEMRDDIARLLAGEPVTASMPVVPLPVQDADETRVVPLTPASPIEAAPVVPVAVADEVQEDEEKRRRVSPWLIGALALALVAAMGFGVWRFFNPSEPQVAQVEVPWVKGSTEEGAKSTLQNQGLKVGTITYENKGADTKGQVTGQDPAGQTRVPAGTKVNLVVNLGPKTSTVPTGLKGLTAAEAKKKLEAAGFKVTQVNDNPATEDVSVAKGTVTKVSPAEGAEVSAGDTVELTIATGKSVVPDLKSMLVKDAIAAAARAGFTVVESSNAGASETGTVVSQTPAAGTTAERSAPITITVSRPSATPTPEPTPEPSPSPAPNPTPTETATVTVAPTPTQPAPTEPTSPSATPTR